MLQPFLFIFTYRFSTTVIRAKRIQWIQRQTVCAPKKKNRKKNTFMQLTTSLNEPKKFRCRIVFWYLLECRLSCGAQSSLFLAMCISCSRYPSNGVWPSMNELSHSRKYNRMGIIAPVAPSYPFRIGLQENQLVTRIEWSWLAVSMCYSLCRMLFVSPSGGLCKFRFNATEKNEISWDAFSFFFSLSFVSYSNGRWRLAYLDDSFHHSFRTAILYTHRGRE